MTRMTKKILSLLVVVLSVVVSSKVQANFLNGKKNIKKIANEVQNMSPDNSDYFEESFPRPEELKQTENKTGSLWVDNYSSQMYNNLHRASQVGDVVTVVIEESASGTQSANTKAERKSSDKFIINGLFGMLSKLTSMFSGLDPAQTVDVEHNNKHDGKGETKRKGELEAKLTARVIKVLKNGDMMIRGQKNIKVNGEDQSLIVEGFIRPYDISSSNEILSTFIADARITLNGFGPVADKQNPGWFTRILDHILPF